MDINRISFNPHQLFDTIYISFKPMADSKQLELNYHCNESLNRVYIGDPFRIRQIAENLLSNALKFTKEGSITLQAALENGQLHFSISDTGCGISQEEQQRIFQEFTRLHNAQGQEGFGLGLAITRKLVLLLEGDIKIESEQGKGSRFHVYLPLPEGPSHPDENPSGPEAEHTPASPDATGIRQIDTPREDSEPIHLILIDDDRIQLQLTTAMLERPGVTVTCCHHPEELLDKLKEKHFDALLTDIQMPAMNGFDLLKAIRTLDTSWVQTLPVIALTAPQRYGRKLFPFTWLCRLPAQTFHHKRIVYSHLPGHRKGRTRRRESGSPHSTGQRKPPPTRNVGFLRPDRLLGR